MKQLRIEVQLTDFGEIKTRFQHKGFSSSSEYSTEQLLLTIGILDNLKRQLQEKISTMSRPQEEMQ